MDSYGYSKKREFSFFANFMPLSFPPFHIKMASVMRHSVMWHRCGENGHLCPVFYLWRVQLFYSCTWESYKLISGDDFMSAFDC